jgi:hypothetical protein
MAIAVLPARTPAVTKAKASFIGDSSFKSKISTCQLYDHVWKQQLI